MRFVETWARGLTGHAGAFALLAAGLTLAAVPGLARLRVDNSIEAWIDRDGPAWAQYRELVERFGSDEVVILAFRPPDLFDPAFLERQSTLAEALETIPGVERVDGVPRLTGFPTVSGLQGPALEEEVRRSPLYRNVLVSEDGTTGALWARLRPGGSADRARTVEEIRRAVDGASLGTPVHLAGPPVVNVALDRASRRDSRRFFPLVFVVSAVVLLALFRHPGAVLVPFASVGAGTAWTLGLLGYAGRPLDMVTLALPPVLWVLGLSTSIHLVVQARRRLAAGATPDAAVRETLEALAKPCFWSAVTTAAGFASLLAASMPPVRTLGAFAALGVLLCLAANVLLFPALARLLLRPSARAPEPRRPARRRLPLGVRRPRSVVAVSAVLALGTILAASRIRAESNVLAYLPDDSPIAVTYRQVLPDFTGPFSLEVLWTAGGEAESLGAFRRMEAFGRAAEAHPDVAKVLSAADLLAKVHQVRTASWPERAALPGTPETFRGDWKVTKSTLPDEVTRYFDPSDGTFRISVLARPMGSAAHRGLVEDLKRQMDRHFEPRHRPRITGVVDLLVDLQDRLVTSQIASFSLAFAVIVPVLAALLRSWRWSLLALPVNLLPLGAAVGLLGLLDWPLDPATVMIAGVALGISVDDTIHLLSRYRRGLVGGDRPREALRRSLEELRRPLAWTSLVAGLGFLVLVAAGFVPLVHFGVLMAVALAAALAADLLLLPALLVLAEGRGG